MSLDRHSATARIAREVRAAEASISASLSNITALLHSAAVAQASVEGAPAAKSHAALLRLSKMVSGILAVQGDAARVHGQMLDIHRELAGPAEPTDCPEMGFATGYRNNVAA